MSLEALEYSNIALLVFLTVLGQVLPSGWPSTSSIQFPLLLENLPLEFSGNLGLSCRSKRAEFLRLGLKYISSSRISG